MMVMAPPHPLVSENVDAFSLNVFYVSSLQTLFERVVDIGFCQGYQSIRRNQVSILQKEDVI